MKLQIKQQGKTILAILAGEIDLRETARLRQEVDNYIEHSGVDHLVFDFTQVNFIDSSGLGGIIGRYRKMTQKGGRVSIAGAVPAVEKVLIFSGIQKIIPLYPIVEEVPL